MSRLPDGWKIAHIEQVVKPKDGLRRGPFGGALKKNIFVEQGYKVYEQGNVIKQNLQLTRYYITPEKYAELKAFQVRPNDFLVTCSGTGTVGKIIRVNSNAEPGIINQALLRIRLIPEIIDDEFFEHQFRSDIIQDAIIDNTQGGAVPNLVGMDLFRKISLYLPPLPEQREIASILSTWDEAITLTEQLIGALRWRKQALMQVLLTGRVRFREFEGSEWEEVVLGVLGNTYGGLSNKSKEDFGRGRKYIPYKNVFENNSIDPNWVDYVAIEAGENQNRVQYGDIIFTTSSETPDEVGMSSVLLDEIGERYLNSFCFGFRLHDFETLLPEFARFLFRAPTFRQEIFKLSQGSTRYNLSKRELMKLVVRIPRTQEQREIAQFMSDVDESIALWSHYTVKLHEQKRGLMQQLLTGAVRVGVNDE